jgi:chromate transporter
MTLPDDSPSADLPAALPASALSLFVAFTALALQGFGGVLAVAQRVLVDERRWLNRDQFLELLGLCQILPGPNICNLALMVGDRFFGWRGAVAALSGMLAVPLLLVLLATVAYAQVSAHAPVSGALHGMGAVAAGMIAGSALRLLPAARANPLNGGTAVFIGTAVFTLVGLARLPLLWVLPIAGPAACWLAWRHLRRAGEV